MLSDMIMMKAVLVLGTALEMPGLATPVALDAKECSLSSEKPKVSS